MICGTVAPLSASMIPAFLRSPWVVYSGVPDGMQHLLDPFCRSHCSRGPAPFMGQQVVRISPVLLACAAERLAELGGLDLHTAQESTLPETRVALQVHTETPAAATGPDPGRDRYAVQWLPRTVDRADKRLLPLPLTTEGKALAPEEKQRQIAQLSETLFAVELDLATLMFDAWRDGQNVEVRSGNRTCRALAVRNVVPRAAAVRDDRRSRL